MFIINGQYFILDLFMQKMNKTFKTRETLLLLLDETNIEVEVNIHKR
jgi:hypothetical protein